MSKRTPLPSQEVLRQLLDYDPETGQLTWRERPLEAFATSRAASIWNKRFAGKPAFTYQIKQGYLRGSLDGKTLAAHRVIWKWMTGEEPVVVDHENGQESDNRWSNLRATNQRHNSRNQARRMNNTSGVSGVSYRKGNQKWQVRIADDQHVGYFQTFNEAVAARKAAEKLHGYHPNHGR